MPACPTWTAWATPRSAVLPSEGQALLLARLPCVLTMPCPHSLLLPLFCNITSFPHILCCGPGLSLACLCWAGYPAELAPQGPFWEQGSSTRGPPLATFWGRFLSGPHRFSPGMLGRARAFPSLHLTHPHTTRPRLQGLCSAHPSQGRPQSGNKHKRTGSPEWQVPGMPQPLPLDPHQPPLTTCLGPWPGLST